MTPQEQLKALEAKMIEKGLDVLTKLAEQFEAGNYFKKCKHQHLEEQIKLAHRVRSLLA